jgi:hypothetical protein
MTDACMYTIFSQNKQYKLSTVSVGTLSIQHNKCRMMKEMTNRPTPMMTEQTRNGFKPTADDYNISNEAGTAVHSCIVHIIAGMWQLQ